MASGPILFTDEPHEGKASLDFPNYVKTLSELILNSKPPYTIGIFGGWGTGKTTLMKKVEKRLINDKCRCIEFNAWRFSSEKKHATYPLMLSIISKLLSEKELKDEVTKKNALKNVVGRVVRGLKGEIGFGIPGIVNASVLINPQEMKKTPSREELTVQELRDLSKPILLDGFDLIQNLLGRISSSPKNPELKLVIFVDDLDRCTPEKAAEIFESIKLFFDISGIVFVLGLSHEIVEAAINVKYKDFEALFSGKDYLKKIIQIPFQLPIWNDEDSKDYLRDILKNYQDYFYKQFFEKNIEMIVQGVEHNPREIKRMLNNFILSSEIYKRKDENSLKKLLAIQILSFRWREIYQKFLLEPQTFYTIIKKLGDKEPIAIDGSIKYNLNDFGVEFEKEILKDLNLVKFLKGEGRIIPTITERELPSFRRATVIEPELETKKTLEPIDKEPEVEMTPHIKKAKPARTHEIHKSGGLPNGGQIQEKLAETIEVMPDEYGIIQFRYLSLKQNCSDFRIHIKLDGNELDVTDWLGYPSREPFLELDSDVITITNVTSGPHKLTLQPEGRIGGCNKGFVEAWEGKLELYQ